MNLNATLIIQVISFLILVWLLVKILYRPFLSFLDERSQKIHNMLQEARESQQRTEDNFKDSKAQLKKTKEEVLKLKGLAEKQSDEHRQKVLQEAKEEARHIIARSKEDIDRRTREVKRDIKKEIGDFSVSIAEKILDKEINKEDHKHIIDEFLKNLSEKR